ncbi:glucan endo-1,3-beta-glucosidase 4 isoform X2 [Carex littledalei]|uniref:Glucan endo-1,3-beta-glucosidase 4 isoform X2 n=1 Tax=Carex littledalei TaxID=544730 RepID=A0A833QF35_9POAL|nr:glucan endo-1,3-beta-glucosidase 4 isoform X2 [Carex littledalei]
MPLTRWWICILLLISLISVGSAQNSSSTTFCVAIATADPTALQEGLNWACGSGGADCSPIQEGQVCYEANNLVELASYAYNDYYHKAGSSGGTCNFNGTATTVTTDPSHGSCIFSGSTQSNTTTTTTNSSSTGFAPNPMSSLFSPPPPSSLTGFSNTSITSPTDGTFSKSTQNAVSLYALVYTTYLVLLLHLLSCYI